MSSVATPSFGVSFQMADVNGANFAEIALLADFNFALTTSAPDSTVHNQQQPWMQATPTLHKFGPIELKLNFAPSDGTHEPNGTGLLYVQKNRQTRQFRIVFPNGGPTWYGPAIVTAFKYTGAVAGIQSAAITIEGNGMWTLA